MGGEGGVLELEIAVFFEGGDGTRGGDQDGSERGFDQWWGERGGGGANVIKKGEGEWRLV